MYSPLFHAPLLAFRREFRILCSLQFFSFLKVENVKALLKVETSVPLQQLQILCNGKEEAALEEMKKELKARPAEKTVHDLYKKVKILQV